MSGEKLHHHERFIQLSGLALLISPFTNFFLSVVNTESVYSKWTGPALWKIATTISWFHWSLWALSFSIGLMMMKGRRSSWISVLAMLGIFIVVNLFQMPREFEKGHKFLPVMSLLFNCAIFVMLYWVEFKQVAPLQFIPKAKKPAVTPPVSPMVSPAAAPGAEIAIPSLLNTVIEFEGVGPWATIIEMNEKEVCVESFQKPPPEIFKQTVDLILSEHQVLVLRAHSQFGNKYFFRYEGMIENKVFHKIS
jgi:hypothetical protein